MRKFGGRMMFESVFWAAFSAVFGVIAAVAVVGVIAVVVFFLAAFISVRNEERKGNANN